MRAGAGGIVVALGLALLVPGSVVGQEASPSASEAATEVLQAESVEAAASATEWTRLDEPPGAKDGQLPVGMAVGPDGGVSMLWGIQKPGPAGLSSLRLWHSVDGASWGEVSLPKANQKTFVDAIKGSPEGVYVLGNPPGPGVDGLLWMSPDGVEWQNPYRLKGAAVADVAVGPEGFVVVGTGRSGQNISPSVWTSVDGEEWKVTKLTKNEGPSLNRVAVSPDGAIVVVGNAGYMFVRDEPVMWRSADGTKFTKVSMPKGDFFGLASTPSGFLLATGQDDIVTISSSADGAMWSPVASADGNYAVLNTTDDGTVVVASIGGESTALVSADGSEWRELDLPETNEGESVLGAVHAGDGMVFAYGLAGTNPFSARPVTWAGLTPVQPSGDVISVDDPPVDEG